MAHHGPLTPNPNGHGHGYAYDNSSSVSEEAGKWSGGFLEDHARALDTPSFGPPQHHSQSQPPFQPGQDYPFSALPLRYGESMHVDNFFADDAFAGNPPVTTSSLAPRTPQQDRRTNDVRSQWRPARGGRASRARPSRNNNNNNNNNNNKSKSKTDEARSCCKKSYGSKSTLNRHRYEDASCPHGRGKARKFRCFRCVTKTFGRRDTLKQHLREVHDQSKDEARRNLDTWYDRWGKEKFYPDVMRQLNEEEEEELAGAGW